MQAPSVVVMLASAGSQERKLQTKFEDFSTMTAATRGTMRPNGRSPPFLAIGLFIALCVMAFNYWNLSAKNAEQANELTILNSEKLAAVSGRSAAENRISSFNAQVEKLQKDLSTANSLRESETNRLAEERKEIEENCDEEKRSLSSQLDQCKALSQELKEKVDGFSCDEKLCQSYMVSARERTLREVLNAAGIVPLLTMHQKGLDLGPIADELAEEFQREIQRQQQLAQLQGNQVYQQQNVAAQAAQQQVQADQQPNQAEKQPDQQAANQPDPQVVNQAGQQAENQAGQQAENQAGQQAENQPDQQGNQMPPQPNQDKEDQQGNNQDYQPKDRLVAQGQGYQSNQGLHFQHEGNQPVDGNQNGAGRLDSLVDRLRGETDGKGVDDTGARNLPVLPKPGNGNLQSSLGSNLTSTVTGQTQQKHTEMTTTPKHNILPTKTTTLHHTADNEDANPHDKDNDDHLPAPDEKDNAEDEDEDEEDDDADGIDDDQDYEYADENQEQYDDEEDDIDDVDDDGLDDVGDDEEDIEDAKVEEMKIDQQ